MYNKATTTIIAQTEVKSNIITELCQLEYKNYLQK